MKALVLVDLEKEWQDKESDYYAKTLSDAIPRINKIIDFCRSKGYKIIFVQHVEKKGDAFAEGSENIQIIDELHKESGDVVITKHAVSPFYKTFLDKELEDVDGIVVAGVLINLCVRSLIHDAYDRDFDITVVKDCCVALDDETHAFTIKDLQATREEIEFVDLSEFA